MHKSLSLGFDYRERNDRADTMSPAVISQKLRLRYAIWTFFDPNHYVEKSRNLVPAK